MAMLGELFPGSKISDEAGEDGNAQKWRLGPIDLERGVVQVHRRPEPVAAADADPDRSPANEPPAGDPDRSPANEPPAGGA